MYVYKYEKRMVELSMSPTTLWCSLLTYLLLLAYGTGGETNEQTNKQKKRKEEKRE